VTYSELDEITIPPTKVAKLDKNAKNDLNKLKVKTDPRARHAYTEFVLNMVTAKSYGNAEKSVEPELGECNCFLLCWKCISITHLVFILTFPGVPRASVSDFNETAREHGLDNSYLGEECSDNILDVQQH
jgi:hypothetical protein